MPAPYDKMHSKSPLLSLHTGEVRIGIFAKKDIPANEEITYDYMFQSSGLAAAAAAYRCLCCHPLHV